MSDCHRAAVHELKPDHLRIIEALLEAGAQVREAEYPSGDERIDEATALYERAAACQPMDAMEELHVAMARAELHEES